MRSFSLQEHSVKGKKKKEKKSKKGKKEKRKKDKKEKKVAKEDDSSDSSEVSPSSSWSYRKNVEFCSNVAWKSPLVPHRLGMNGFSVDFCSSFALSGEAMMCFCALAVHSLLCVALAGVPS